jgi:hypothetical protein
MGHFYFQKTASKYFDKSQYDDSELTKGHFCVKRRICPIPGCKVCLKNQVSFFSKFS